MSRSEDTLYRQWLMLSKIPRYPRKIKASALKNILAGEGFEIDVRTVQRDLDKLSVTFPLNYDTEGRTNYWFWLETASVQDLPGMEPVTALAFQMAESYLVPILPQATLTLLQPYFQRAREVLQSATQSQLKHWPDKVAVISRGPELLKPMIKADIQQTVYDALLQERQLKAVYKPRKQTRTIDAIVHPLGIVNRHGIIYLVCTLWNYQDIKQLALHRFRSAQILPDKSQKPSAFKLSDYVRNDHQFAYPLSPEPIDLKMLMSPQTGEHLYETPLSANQTITTTDDGRLLIEASLPDTQELRWWLSGFGSQVEVLAPAELRDYFFRQSVELMAYYRDSAI